MLENNKKHSQSQQCGWDLCYQMFPHFINSVIKKLCKGL